MGNITCPPSELRCLCETQDVFGLEAYLAAKFVSVKKKKSFFMEKRGQCEM